MEMNIKMNINLINHKCITNYGCVTCNSKKHSMKFNVFLIMIDSNNTFN